MAASKGTEEKRLRGQQLKQLIRAAVEKAAQGQQDGGNGMKIDNKVGSVEIKLDTSRLDDNLREAQKLLNMQVVADCEPYVPFRQGALRGSVHYPQGIYGGEIEYNSPYAHYLYEGIVYGPNVPIKDGAGNITGYWSPPKKYPTDRKLQYHQPGTGEKWYEKAKRERKGDWIRLVKETAGKA